MSELGDASAVRKVAVMADTMETVGQDMEQEAADELAGIEGHHLPLVMVAIIFPEEADPAVGESNQAAVGDGDAVGVAGFAVVTRHSRARPKRTAVGSPGQSGNLSGARVSPVRRHTFPGRTACYFYSANGVDYGSKGDDLRTRPMTDTQLVVPAPPPPSPGAERMRRHRRRRQKGMRSLMIDVRETENRCVNTSRAARSW